MHDDRQFDVIIIGGGLVGLSLYLALSIYGIKVAVIEKQSPVVPGENENRGIALSKTSLDILSNLGLQDLVSTHGYPLQAIHVSEQGKFGTLRLQAKDTALSMFGAVIDYNRLVYALATHCEFFPEGIFYDFEMLSAKLIENAWQVDIQSKNGESETLFASLLIAADGVFSPLRKQFGIGISQYDYQQTALVMNLLTSTDHQNVAYERFTKEGVLAMLPFGANRAKCVWTADKTQIEQWLKLSDIELLHKVQLSFGYRLGLLKNLSARFTYPLIQVQAKSLIGERSLLLGSAANHMHPIAAQGFNLALRDVAYLTEILVSIKKKQSDVGAPAVLQEYVLKRQSEHRFIQNMIHQLHQLFHSKHKSLQVARRLGLITSEYLPFVKAWIVKKGVQGDGALPKLAYGDSL